MGDYKRFISYIYSYEKGIKSKNSGFAKVESRDGICKINISLRIDDTLMGDSSDNTLIVFLYRQMDNEFRKIKIGNIEISKAASVFKAQVDSKNICDSGMEIDEIDGIFICTETYVRCKNMVDIVYGSEWKDIAIDVKKFIVNEENIENKTELKAANSSEDEKRELMDILDENEMSSGKDEEEEDNKKESDKQDSGVEDIGKEMTENLTKDSDFRREPEIADYYAMLTRCYPMVRNAGIKGECIKITPHDISYLPRKYWHLGSNSFLLHSFYNYGYILLLKESDRSYAILAPGSKNNKEQSMAKIYGFSRFENRDENGNRGYWFLYL